MRRRLVSLAGAAALALCLSACEVEVGLGIDVEGDGSGTVRASVTLDEEAADAVGDIGDELRVDDLRDAGWTVDVEQRRVVATRRFATAADARDVVAHLSGPDGPFRDFEVTQDRSFVRTRTSMSGVVDLTAGLEAFGDAELTETLGGRPLGADAAELERILGAPAAEVFRFSVAGRLPGSIESSNAPTELDGGAVWRPALGERVELRATASRVHTGRLVAAGMGVAALVALVLTFLRRRSVGAEGARVENAS